MAPYGSARLAHCPPAKTGWTTRPLPLEAEKQTEVPLLGSASACVRASSGGLHVVWVQVTLAQRLAPSANCDARLDMTATGFGGVVEAAQAVGRQEVLPLLPPLAICLLGDLDRLAVQAAQAGVRHEAIAAILQWRPGFGANGHPGVPPSNLDHRTCLPEVRGRLRAFSSCIPESSGFIRPTGGRPSWKAPCGWRYGGGVNYRLSEGLLGARWCLRCRANSPHNREQQ